MCKSRILLSRRAYSVSRVYPCRWVRHAVGSKGDQSVAPAQEHRHLRRWTTSLAFFPTCRATIAPHPLYSYFIALFHHALVVSVDSQLISLSLHTRSLARTR
jgi:hypothetical protein